MLDAFLALLFDTLLTGVFYWPGWLVLRAATFGRYPPPAPTAHNTIFVATVGAATPFVIIAILLA